MEKARGIFIIMMIVIIETTFCGNWDDLSYYRINFLSIKIVQEKIKMTICHLLSGDI